MTAGEVLDQVKCLFELDPNEFTDRDVCDLIGDALALLDAEEVSA